MWILTLALLALNVMPIVPTDLWDGTPLHRVGIAVNNHKNSTVLLSCSETTGGKPRSAFLAVRPARKRAPSPRQTAKAADTQVQAPVGSKHHECFATWKEVMFCSFVGEKHASCPRES